MNSNTDSASTTTIIAGRLSSIVVCRGRDGRNKKIRRRVRFSGRVSPDPQKRVRLKRTLRYSALLYRPSDVTTKRRTLVAVSAENALEELAVRPGLRVTKFPDHAMLDL